MTTQFDVTNTIIKADAKNLGLTSSDKLVLITISTFFSKTGKTFTCNPSHSTISKASGCGVSTVKRSITKLETLKYISSEQRLDNSKVYTWLTLEAEKSSSVVSFIEATKRARESKKQLKAIRGENLGRNTHKIKQLEQILESSPNCYNTRESLKLVKEARSNNVYWKDYEPYKSWLSERVTVIVEEPKQTYQPSVKTSPVAAQEPESMRMSMTTPVTSEWDDLWDDEDDDYLPF